MKNVAIIPARSGSKRIPQKNIRNFLGKPIIAYSIESALKSNLFQEVMVSTDSREIAVIAQSYGARVPFFRSKEKSDDHAGLFEVALEVLTRYEEKKIFFDNVCMILATAPFINRHILKRTYELFVSNDFDTVFPICRFRYPILRSLKIEDGKIRMIWPENMHTRSQDLPDAYHDAGLFYWGRRNTIARKKSFFTDNSMGLVIKERYAHDIDTDEDWEIAELKYKILTETGFWNESFTVD
ncbi:MAG: pseudaminic acid cytidylyltransferase [bacterium]